jgi:hypothetical protein
VSREFDDLVDAEGLEPEQERRLRRVHDLLVEAGPPPDLPPALEQPPTGGGDRPGEIVQFPLHPGRRRVAVAVLAAALAAAAFGIGFLIASGGDNDNFDAQRVVAMHGRGDALASIRLGEPDSVGNWPMELAVTGLPEQPRRGYYALWLTRDGKPIAVCGTFRVHDKKTVVRLNAPYQLKRFDGWIVTEQPPGVHEPGRIVLSTA